MLVKVSRCKRTVVVEFVVQSERIVFSLKAAGTIVRKRQNKLASKTLGTCVHATELLSTDEDEPADEAGSAHDPIDGDPAASVHGSAGTH